MVTLLHSSPGFFSRTLFFFYNNQYAQTYFGLVLYLAVAFALSGLLATVAYLLSLSSSQDSEKRSVYECGYAPFDNATRLPVEVHFYLVGILFLIFDVEVALLYPWVLGLQMCGWTGYFLMMFFLAVLGLGFVYEWRRGALAWSRHYKQF